MRVLCNERFVINKYIYIYTYMLHQFKTGGPFWHYLLGVTSPLSRLAQGFLFTTSINNEREGGGVGWGGVGWGGVGGMGEIPKSNVSQDSLTD